MTYEKIIEIISESSAIPTNEIASEDALKEIGIDSLKIVELIINIEDGLNINFEDSDLNPAELINVEDVFVLIKKYVNIEG